MTEQDGPRIPTLKPGQWTGEVRAALAVFSEPLSKLGSDGKLEALGSLPNVLTTVLQHPALAAAFFPLSRYLLHESSLDDRSRELLILRTGWLRKSEYEWAQHVELGKRAGLEDEEIKRVAGGADAGGWSDYEVLLLRAADELNADARLSDATWQALSGHLDRQQMMDLVFTVGAYDMLAMAFNSFGLELDSGLRGFSDTT